MDDGKAEVCRGEIIHQDLGGATLDAGHVEVKLAGPVLEGHDGEALAFALGMWLPRLAILALQQAPVDLE